LSHAAKVWSCSMLTSSVTSPASAKVEPPLHSSTRMDRVQARCDGLPFLRMHPRTEAACRRSVVPCQPCHLDFETVHCLRVGGLTPIRMIVCQRMAARVAM